MWSIGSSVQRLSSLFFHALEPRPNAAPSLRPMMGEQLNKYNVGAASYRLENNGHAQSLTFVSDVALLVISIGEVAGNDFADSKKGMATAVHAARLVLSSFEQAEMPCGYFRWWLQEFPSLLAHAQVT